MLPRLLLYTVTSLLCFLAAHEACAQSQSRQVTEFPKAELVAHFPFQELSGGIIIVRATVDDFTDSLNFIMDTGSGGISLDSTTADKLHLATVLSERVVKGIAGVKPVRFIYNQKLNLPGLVVRNLDFHTNDYEILSEVYGLKIDGIIGYDFLRQFVLEINYDSLTMNVYRPGKLRYPEGGFFMRPEFSTLPMVHLTIRDDHRLDGEFYFDTGAGLCFLMSKEYSQDSAVLSRHHKPVQTEAEGLGGKALMSLTIMKTLHVGPYVFHDIPSYILDDEYNVTNYPALGGLVGNDLLRRFNIFINYPFREFYLVPNSHFRDLFDYSYTGMSIYYVDGKVIISDIQKDSPAQESGLKEGDELFAVDNNFSHNIQVYKNLLQNAGARLKIIVIRNGSPIMVNLKIRKIS
jgi:hypothetical protein